MMPNTFFLITVFSLLFFSLLKNKFEIFPVIKIVKIFFKQFKTKGI